MSRYLVTAALPYANGPIHLGHLAGAYLPADIFVRYRKLNGDDVVYICGSDEHGVPITIRAERESVSPRDIVDRFHKDFAQSFQEMGVRFDNFSGTARDRHYKLSQEFFRDLLDGDHIMEKTEDQFYDEKSGRFLPDRYVEGICPKCGYEKARGDQCDHCGSLLTPTELVEPRSALSGEKPVIRQTKHWYLKLQDFQQDLVEWLKSKTEWKDNVRNFILGWLGAEGLHERAITRDISWGVPVPLGGAEGKVLYVWFDAPIGYISSTIEWAEQQGDPERWKKYWLDADTRLVHFIGKDNIPFHAVIWPSMLMGKKENYVLPYDIPANEYLNLEGQKISTSNNWAVWVNDYLDVFSPDPLRYALAANAPESKDADFTWKSFQSHNNDELANIIGNFVNRSLTFIRKNVGERVPGAQYEAVDEQVFTDLTAKVEDLTLAYSHYKVREASKLMLDISRIGNKYFDEMKPWVLKKGNPDRLLTVLNVCLNILRVQAVAMYPIVPFSAEKLWEMLGETGSMEEERWKVLTKHRISEGQILGEPEILFVKYEDELIQKQVDALILKSKKKKEEKVEVEEKEKARITFDEFKKIEFRVAEIIQAEPIEKSKKLIRLKVRVGEVEKQILAGIKQFYEPENLLGKKIVIVNNLEPAKLMGELSEGMLLAASNDDKSILRLLTIDGELESGAQIN